MTGKRSAIGSRRVLILFVLVVAFTTAEFSWWMFFSLRNSRHELASLLYKVEQDRVLATQLVALQGHVSNPSFQTPSQILEKDFPHLEWVESGPLPSIQLDVILERIRVRPGFIEKAEEQYRSRVYMFLGEGGVFFVVLMVGAWLIFRTMRSEVRLQLQEANFLSAVTHELKSPLASIRLYVETMQLRDSSPEKRAHYLRNIREDIERLEVLIGNLLSVARLEAHDLKLAPEPRDITADTERVLAPFSNEMRERGFAFNVDLPSEGLQAIYDGAVYPTLLRNLLDNSVKYGGDDKKTSVRLRRTDDCAVLEVSDRGIGLDPKERKRIFEKFYRVGDEMVRQTEGSGLGLYLVRALAEEGGGKVSVESAGLGKGSTFRVTFPLDIEEIA